MTKHYLYILSNSIALVHSMQDPQVTVTLKQILLGNQLVRSLLKLQIPQELLPLDYHTRKELLVFAYYLMEFAESSLLTEVWGADLDLSGVSLLGLASDVVHLYSQNDPHTV